MSCGSLLSLSASSLEVDVAFFMASFMHPYICIYRPIQYLHIDG